MRLFLLVFLVVLAAPFARAQADANPTPKVALGPAQIPLRAGALTATLPPGLRFVSAQDLRAAGPVGGGDALLGAFTPKEPTDGGDFAVTLLWLDDGHVPEDDARALDGDTVLATLRAELAAGNDARRASGRPEVTIVGFVEPPRFDAKDRVITFVWRGKSGEEERICYDARKLTRAGAVACSAVGPEASLAKLATATNAVLAGLQLAPGHRYDDFTAGDPTGKWAMAKRVAVGVFEQLSTWQKVLLGFLALSAAWALVKGVGSLLRR